MKVRINSIAFMSIFLLAQGQANAQGSPAPGAGAPAPIPQVTRSTSTSSAPPPGSGPVNSSQVSKPKTGSKSFSTGKNATLERITSQRKPASKLGAKSIYNKLPITLEDAKNRLDELSSRLKTSPSASLSAVKNDIFAISEWLQDVASAHWKIYKAFDKSALTKEKAKSERAIALAFSHLKNRAKLIKADLYIKQNRYPEALEPLVDIVVAEPASEVGKEAYKRLCDMGFSNSVENLEIANNEAKGEKK